MSHRTFIQDAKNQQQHRLNDSNDALDQLAASMAALVAGNSLNHPGSSSAVIDKISTVHELDKEINRQLDDDIAANYVRVVREKEKLAGSVKKARRGLSVDSHSSSSYVDVLQRRMELADQEIRILENTLDLVRLNKQ